MFGMTLLRGTATAVALAAASFVGTSASAGGCDYDSGYNNNRSTHHDHVEVRHHGNHDHVTVRHHTTTRHGNHSHSRERVTQHTTRHSNSGYRNDGYSRDYQQPSGYYRQVWTPAVYRTYYDDCGYPYRVKVRSGYYRRVWVSNSRGY